MNFFLLLFLILHPSFALGQSFSISQVRFQGEGCVANSAVVDISPDQKAFTVIFSDYFAEVRNDGGQEKTKMSCQVTVDVVTTPGWTFSLGQMDIRGYANVEQGATVRQKVAYAFDGSMIESDGFRVDGPFNSNFIISTDVNLGQKNKWSRCETNLHRLSIRTSLMAKAKVGSGGYIAADSLDGEFKEKFQVLWKPCSNQRNGNPPRSEDHRGRGLLGTR